MSDQGIPAVPTPAPAPMPAPVPSPIPAAAVVATKPNKGMMCLIGIVIVLLVALIIGLVALFIYLLQNNAKGTASTGNPPASSPQQGNANNGNANVQPIPEPPVAGIADGKAFYISENNIYSYDVATTDVEQWTVYPANPTSTPAYDADGVQIPSISIQSLRVIDSNTIGFGVCAIITGDFGCEIDTIDLTTGDITNRKNLNYDQYLLSLGFDTAERFAYLAESSATWELLFDDSGVMQTLESLSAGAYGRGGFVEDSQTIKFSNDGLHMLHISTSSPRDVTDFNIYVYDLAAGTSTVITNGTQPDWFDNDRIIFRTYNSAAPAGNGISIYTLSTDTVARIDAIGTDSYAPQILDGTKVLYTDFQNTQIWIYDVDTSTTSMLVDNAVGAKWLNTNQFIYTNTQPCADPDMCMMNYESVSASLFNLDTMTSELLPIDVSSSYWITTLYD